MRCPLTLKFGRDVAGLINFEVWKISVRAVNKQYLNCHDYHESSGSITHITGFWFNWRVQGHDGMIVNMRSPWQASYPLSKNYW